MIKPFLVIFFAAWAHAQTAYTGLGASTMMCLDRDGDGYGVGPTVGTETATGVTGVAVNTTISSSINSGSQTVTPSSMANILVGMRLRVVYLDASGVPPWPGNIEYVPVTATTGTTFTATFQFAHASTPVLLTDLGCLGPDADDLDATVHTGQQLVAKYSPGHTPNAAFTNAEVKTALAALYTLARGYSTANNPNYVIYNPAHVWYLAPGTGTAACTASSGNASGCTGNDGTGVEDDPSHPFQHWSAISAAVTTAAASAEVAVVMRDGYTDQLFLPNGLSASTPVILMGMPGELPVFTTTSTQGPFISGHHYIILDNMKFTAGACGSFGDTNPVVTSHDFHDIIFRHIDGNCGSAGMGEGGISQTSGMVNLTYEDSNWHDNGEHGLYIGCNQGAPCTGVTVQRNVFFNNGQSGFGGNGIHVNGVMNGIVIKQNLFTWNTISGMDLRSGVINSTIAANVILSASNSFGNGSGALVMNNYKDNPSCQLSGGVGQVVCRVNSASWAAGRATIAFSNAGASGGTSAGVNFIPGAYMYVDGFTGPYAGYNCAGSGWGCVITAVTNQGTAGVTVEYSLAADPGVNGTPTCQTIRGCVANMGVGDETGNLIENNTLITVAQINMGGSPAALLVSNFRLHDSGIGEYGQQHIPQ